MLPKLLAAFVAAAPLTAAAECYDVGVPLFSCTFKGGQTEVSICLQDTVALYEYGPNGSRPDIILGRNVRDVTHVPWPGIGRTYWEELAFYNDGYSYRVAYGVDRMTEGGEEQVEVSGIVVIRQGEATVAELTCDEGTVDTHGYDDLYSAKVAAGQSFCLETRTWEDACN